MKKIFLLFILPLMCFTLLFGVKTFAMSNIDLEYDNPESIYSYKFSNVIFSTLSLQFNEDNLIEFEFYDHNDVAIFDVSIEIYSQGVPMITIDGEFSGEISNFNNFNFIDEIVFIIDYYSSDFDYLSVIENGYFKIYYIDEEIYNFIEDSSSYLNVDFIVYNQSKGILSTIIGTINSLGLGILGFIKDGFVSFFFVDGKVSNIGIFTFCMLGISLVIGLTCWITSLVRKKR